MSVFSSIMTVSDKCKLALFVLLQDAAQTQFCDHFPEMLMAIHLTLLYKKPNSTKKYMYVLWMSICALANKKCTRHMVGINLQWLIGHCITTPPTCFQFR